MRQEPSEFDARIAAYWHARYPRNASKELQRQFGISEAKADRALRGEVSKDFLYAMMKAEGWRFTAFITQPRGGTDAALPIAPQAESDRAYWFTHDGDMHAAPLGHARFVADYLGLQAGSQDLAGYALRNLGWIEASKRADGLVRLRYVAQVDPHAAARARDWLISDRGQLVDRNVERAGQWVRHQESAQAAIEALDRAAIIASVQETRWRIDRLSHDDMRERSLTDLLHASMQSNRSREELVRIATDLRLMTTSAIFHVKGNAVRALWIGNHLDVNWPAMIGRDLMERDDSEYAGMVRRHVLGAIEESQPTFHHMRGTIDGRPVDYQRLAIAEISNDNERIVLTSSHLLHKRVVAA